LINKCQVWTQPPALRKKEKKERGRERERQRQKERKREKEERKQIWSCYTNIRPSRFQSNQYYWDVMTKKSIIHKDITTLICFCFISKIEIKRPARRNREIHIYSQRFQYSSLKQMQ
jgi:hypothetical protein